MDGIICRERGVSTLIAYAHSSRGGDIFAGNFYALAHTTAPFELVGMEINTDLRVASAGPKIGMQVVDVAQSTGAATGMNAALVFRNQTGAYGYDDAILLTNQGGIFPVRQNGTLIRAEGQATVAGGLDLSGLDMTSFALKTPAWQVNGSNAVHGRRQVVAGLSEGGAVSDSGNKGSVVLLSTTAGSGGDGGGIEFGFGFGGYQSSGYPAYFGAIRGWGLDGSGNTYGDIVVLTRAGVTDTALTEVFRFLGGGGGVKLNGSVRISSGTLAPNTTVIGNPGDLFINVSGTAGGIFWVKTSGTGATGWTAVA